MISANVLGGVFLKDLVSIVLPVYNGEKYLRDSIDSILSQTYVNFELIIIDDCSTDSSPDIAKQYEQLDSRVTYYRNPQNLKLPKSLNRGFSLSNGKYLTWTSDDNVYSKDAIEKMKNVLDREGTDFVFATCDVIDGDGNIVEIIKAPNDYKQAIVGINFVGACFLYTRKVYETLGGYDTDKFLVEDYDYWLKIFARFKVSNIQEVLYKYRWHSGALTSTENSDRINSMCERVMLDNLQDFGKLTVIQKYYVYSKLNNLRQTKVIKAEKNKYKVKAKIYSCFYLLIVRIPNKLKRICGGILV